MLVLWSNTSRVNSASATDLDFYETSSKCKIGRSRALYRSFVRDESPVVAAEPLVRHEVEEGTFRGMVPFRSDEQAHRGDGPQRSTPPGGAAVRGATRRRRHECDTAR